MHHADAGLPVAAGGIRKAWPTSSATKSEQDEAREGKTHETSEKQAKENEKNEAPS